MAAVGLNVAGLNVAGLSVASSGAVDDVTTTTAAPAPGAPRFVTRCTFSHTLSDDPIVKFKQPGASHSHDFFGNVTTNASSTLRTLKTGGTTCINPNDLSGYWVPSLTVDGAVVQPTYANVYYQSAGKPYQTVKTIPRGLKVVAGDAMATSPQSLKFVAWNCGAEEDEIAQSAEAPTCPSPTLTIHVNFPDCWNGTNLDSPDHKSHLAYHSKDGTCPAGYPVPIPRVRVNVHYPTIGGPGVALASGGQYSGHADFFNAWVPTGLRRLVKTCINAGITCNAKA
jgi:Domain of unknown function (DUF1996)